MPTDDSQRRQASLTIHSYVPKDERPKRVRDLAGKLAGASAGETFRYRGLTIEKADTGNRGTSHAIVKDPQGHELDRLKMAAGDTAALVERLDEARNLWRHQQQTQQVL